MSRVASLVFLIAALCLATAPSTSAQDRTRQSREVGSFTEIGLSIPATLHLRQGEDAAVEVEAEQKVLDHLETTVVDGRLKIQDADDSNFFEQVFGRSDWGEVDVYVTAATLETISIAGSGAVLGETPIEGESLALENAGSGEIDLEVSTETLRTSIAGSGTIRLRGTADHVDGQIAGSGTIRAMELTTATAEIEVAGSGDTQLHVTDRLSVQIMGSGDVEYRGTPELETQTLGSGDVRSVER